MDNKTITPEIENGIIENAKLLIEKVDSNIDICLDNAGIVYQDIIDARLEVAKNIKDTKHSILVDSAIAKELEDKVRHMLSMYNSDDTTEDKTVVLTCINAYIDSCNSVFEKIQDSINEVDTYKYILDYLETLAKSKGGL